LDPLVALSKDGRIAIGGQINPDTLAIAYSRGIFPWEDSPVGPVWHAHAPRCVMRIKAGCGNRSLRRAAKLPFTFTTDQAFVEVMQGCADREEGSWITDEKLAGYTELHRRGLAHSVEAWLDNKLVGGLYGVTLGGLFAGESMFSKVSQASKASLAWLLGQLTGWGYSLFDAQVANHHTLALGFEEIGWVEFQGELKKALAAPAIWGA
jgi:leucyl/phenylalanyl-tRNA--protein transferase